MIIDVDTDATVAAPRAEPPCTICGGALAPWLAMPIDPIKNEPSGFANALRCVACGTGSIRPVPSPAEVAGFYRLDAYYTHGAGHIAEVAPSIADRALIKLAYTVDRGEHFDAALAATVLPPAAKVVDLGCGDGALIGELKAAGFEVVGVDPDPSAQARGAERGINIRPGTAESPPADLPHDAFDLVVMSHSLEHCIDPSRAMRNAAALLKRSGLLYCEVPNCAATHFDTFTVTSTMFDAPRHLQFFAPDSLAALVRNHGLVVERRLFSGFTRVFHPSWRRWEATIWDRARQWSPGFKAARHTFMRAVGLLSRTAFARPEAKYDSMGVLARKA